MLRDTDRCGAHDGSEPFVRTYAPRTRLIIVGTGPPAVQLGRVSQLTGFDVVLYSPDGPTREEAIRTPGIEVIAITSPASLPVIHADRHTAIIVMFHDHEWEARLLPPILETDAFYVGAMGSRKTHARRVEMLLRAGLLPIQLDRIRGPAGIFQRGKSASAIAVSILAEVMQASMVEGR